MMPQPQLWDWANAYKVSVSLFALSDTGVLRALAAGPQPASELARRCELVAASLEPLLELMVTSGVLTRSGHEYVLGEAKARILPLVELEARLCGQRINSRSLGETLRGQPPGDPMETASPESAALWPLFLRAMAVGAETLAPHLVRAVQLTAGVRVVDLGGADGTLARALARMLPGVRVTVVDRPAVAQPFAELQRQSPDGAALTFIPGDLREPATFAGALEGADAVIAANVMHLLTPGQRHGLLSVIGQRAAPGAVLAVYDQFLSAERANAASCLVVDWLLCGCPFRDTDVEFSQTLTALGFAAVRSKRSASLPGAIVLAKVGERPTARSGPPRGAGVDALRSRIAEKESEGA